MQYLSSKAKDYIDNQSNDKILSESLSESYFYDNVLFDANTNDRKNQSYQKFKSSIQGSLMTAVALDLSCFPFNKICFEKAFIEHENFMANNSMQNKQNWNDIKKFFNSRNNNEIKSIKGILISLITLIPLIKKNLENQIRRSLKETVSSRHMEKSIEYCTDMAQGSKVETSPGNEGQNFIAKFIGICVKFFVSFYDFCKNLLSAITNYISSKMGCA